MTKLADKTSSDEFSTSGGVSLLEIKYHLLLSYLINLTHVMLMKVQGKSINSCPSVVRLVEIRTILEKIKPLDLKLHYQIDKLIKLATTGNVTGTSNPLHFRPNPGNLVSKLDEPNDDDEMSSDDDGNKALQDKQSNKNVYVPPKLAAVHFADDKEKRRQLLLRKRTMDTSVLEDLREEYSEAPLELKNTTQGLRKRKMIDEEKEQQKFEEDNFIRLNTKRNKSGNTGRRAAEAIDELTDFGGLSNITGDTELPPKRKKLKKKFASKKHKMKIFRKRAKHKR